MTPQSILLGAGAGLISAVVFASATTGPALSRMVFFLLTPFPLYLAGLGLGFLPAAAGAAVAIVSVLVLAGPLVACVFALDAALPAVVLTRLALLGHGEGENRHWYPTGRLIAIAALLAAGGGAAILVASGTADTATLTQKLKPLIVDFVKSQMPVAGDTPALTEAQIDGIAAGTVPLVPGFLGMLLMLTALISLWLAGRVTLASGRLMRPWPDFSRFDLPHGSALMLLTATALSFAGGFIGPLAGCFGGAFYLAFALLGLAVVHYVTQGSPWRNFSLAGLYAALVVLTQYVLLILALIGLAETFFHYRAASDRGVPPDHPRDT